MLRYTSIVEIHECKVKFVIGEPAPSFELLNQDSETVHLSDYRGRKIILFAFPKANTPGCNAQACGFRDEFVSISTSKAVVLGISPDSVESLREWKTQKNLPYDLLSDPDHHVLEQWGAWGISLMGLVRVPMVNRSVWVIDEEGVIIDEQINVSPGGSVKRALVAVGEVAELG